MKLPRPTLFSALILVMICAACAPGLTVNTVPSVVSATPTPPGLIPSPSTGLLQSQQNTALMKPRMQIGSVYRYFDGSLLDAVPNSGPFLMGTGSMPDNPQHQVLVSDFWIYSTKVTNQMYSWCMSLGKCTPPTSTDDPNFGMSQYANYPVVGVTWQQASDYCGFVHGRLPTEAEWEKAASWDGTNNLQLLYPWGNTKASCRMLNFKNCVFHATPVTQYGQGRSFYGLYNAEGDVYEWVNDWYQSNYYTSTQAQDPMGPDAGTQRVVRSSAFDSDAAFAFPALRFRNPPGAHSNDLGFRCVVKDPAYYAPFCTLPVSYGISASPATPTSSKPCPDPVLQHFEGCTQGKQPADFVTVLTNPPTTITVTGMEKCSPNNNDPGVKHVCPPGVTITVNASCGVLPTGVASCPVEYRPDPNNPAQCTTPGGAGACAPGYQYDQSLQCCSIVSGSNAPAPLCTVGQHLFEGKCVDDSIGSQEPQSLTYVTGGWTCGTGGGPSGSIGGYFIASGAGSSSRPTLITVPTNVPAAGLIPAVGGTTTP